MSYCVNCGVELDSSAKKCALCQTPVINPNLPGYVQDAPPPYPEKVVLPAGVRRRFAAFIFTMVILIPNIVCAIINALFPSTGIWALYVVTSSALFWTLFVQPFMWKKVYVYSQRGIDVFAVTAYIYVFYAVGNEKGWFYRIALPLVLLVGLLLFITAVWLRRKKRDWPDIVNFVLADICVLGLVTDLLFNLFFLNSWRIGYSLITTACTLALIIFFLAVKGNKRFRAWLGRRFFI